MDVEKQKAFESFEELASHIEKAKTPFAHVFRGSNGRITISMGIPKEDLQEPFLKM